MAGRPRVYAQRASAEAAGRRRWPALLLAAGILFPAGWLGLYVPSVAGVLDRLFPNAIAHAVGHIALYWLLGLALLLSQAPGRRPVRALALALPLALAQEALQLIAKARPPGFDEGRDLLTDLLGLALAYLSLRLWLLRRPSCERSDERR